MFPQASEQFADVFFVLFEIIRIDEDVIEMHLSNKSPRMSFINCWNAAGELVRPNGMTNHS